MINIYKLMLCFALLGFCACKKTLVTYTAPVTDSNIPARAQKQFTTYTIKSGKQYCENNIFTPAEYSELKFWVRFDSSAVYTTLLPENQFDINKLYGFADNNAHHHEFSARFGWRWSMNALRLFAYVYNSGERSMLEIGTVDIGKDVYCGIKVASHTYYFTLNDKTILMPRQATTIKATGYKLYPYFGGDELAPHDIKIGIKEQE